MIVAMNLVHYLDPEAPPSAKTACGLPCRNGQVILSGRPLAVSVLRASVTCDPCRFQLGMESAPPELVADPFRDLSAEELKIPAGIPTGPDAG